jgi:type I restriction enzyme S subunit
MELKPGYKQTDVGVIPENWELSSVGSMGDVRAGKALAVNAAGQQRPYLRTKNVFDGRIDLADVLRMPMTEAEFSRYRLRRGDVLLNEGQSLELVGRCAMYKDEYPEPCAIQNQLIRFRAGDRVSASFAAHLFRHCQSTGVFAAIALQTTSVAHLGVSRFHRLQLAWPSDPIEQERIAGALDDADALIESLERLIAKKRKMRQGAMQDLLTGKNRLPGFSEEWSTRGMSYYFELVGARNTELNDNVVTISAQLGFVRQEEFFKKRVASKVLENYYLIERGDFAYNRSYSKGYPYGAIKRLTNYDKGVVTTLYICFRLKPNAGADPSFFEHYFEAGLLNPGLATVTNEGGRAHGLLNITKADFSTREVTCPCFSEQVAIAAVLSDMNAEVEGLEDKLVKARKLKQGMMQELLTGRTRLV